MPTHREQITQIVDELIQQGVIARDMRDQYVQLMTSSDAVAERFGGMLMRGQDYTRKTQEVAEQRRQLQTAQEAERQKLAADRAALEQWQSQAQARLAEADQLGRQLPELAAKVAAYEQILSDYNLQEQVKLPTLPGLQTPPQTTHASAALAHPPSGAPSQWLSREEGVGALRELLEQQQQMAIIQARHSQLFGEPLLDPVLTEAMNAGQGVQEYWRAKYNVSAKEAELAQRRRDQEIAAIREQVRTELQAEYASDPNRLVGSATPNGVANRSQILDAYAANRALAANPLQSAEDGASLPPERRGEIAAARSRLDAARAMFEKNFSPDGRPLTEDARALTASYSQ